jgi:hypothetical protein
MKALVLYSGGLDSRLVVEILKEKGYEVEVLFFLLPYSKREVPESDCRIHVVDCTKGKNLREYLDFLKKPRHGVGAGINPCVDCKVFMFRKAEEFRKKIGADLLATGEVPGQRPMSQTKHAFSVIDKRVSGVKRPLIEKGALGRKRKLQMDLAEKYKIKYPSPSGGCLLCERHLAPRIRFLLDKGLINEKTLPLTLVGRHYWINGWVVVARDEKESSIIDKYGNSVKSGKRKPAVYYHNKKNRKTAEKLQEAFEKREQGKFDEFRI